MSTRLPPLLLIQLMLLCRCCRCSACAVAARWSLMKYRGSAGSYLHPPPCAASEYSYTFLEVMNVRVCSYFLGRQESRPAHAHTHESAPSVAVTRRKGLMCEMRLLFRGCLMCQRARGTVFFRHDAAAASSQRQRNFSTIVGFPLPCLALL